jgi:hypothetical protein
MGTIAILLAEALAARKDVTVCCLRDAPFPAGHLS